MRITNISEAKAGLSKFIEQVLNGEEVVIGKAGRSVAKLVPFDLDTQSRDLDQGIWEGKVRMSEYVDDESDELSRLFTGEADDEPAA